MKSEKKESLNEDVLSKFWTFLENWLQSQKLSHMTKEEDLRDLEIINITSHVAYTDHTHAATTWRPCQLPACLCTDVWGKSQSVNHFRHALWLKQNIKQQAGTNSTTPEKKQHSSIRIQTVFFPLSFCPFWIMSNIPLFTAELLSFCQKYEIKHSVRLSTDNSDQITDHLTKYTFEVQIFPEYSCEIFTHLVFAWLLNDMSVHG